MPPEFPPTPWDLYDTLAVGVVVQGLDGAVLYANAAARQMLGQALVSLSTGVAVTAPRRDLLPGELPAAMVVRTGRPLQAHTLTLSAPDGARRHLQVDATPIYDRSGAITQVVSSFTDITVRMREIERLQAMHTHLASGVLLVDRTGHIQDANTVAADLLGVPPEQLRGLSAMGPVWTTRMPDGQVIPADERIVPRVLRSGQPVHEPMTRVQRPDGTSRWLEVHAIPAFDDTGAIEQIVVSYIDLTARVQAEEARIRSEEYLLRLLTVAPVGACIVDEHGIFTLVNAAYAAMLGYSPEELIGQTVMVVIPPEEHAETEALLAQPLTSERMAWREVHLLTRAGEQRAVLGGSVQITGPDGRPQRASFAIDITERRRMEEALRESEERFRTAMMYAPIGMALMGLEGRFLAVNAALCEIVGYNEADLLNLTFQDITYPDDLDADLANAQRLLEGAIRSYQMEKRYFHKQGRVIWILLSGALVRSPAGAPLYFIAQIQDITERKRMETALRESEERFSRAFLASPIGIAITRLADGVFIDANEHYAHIFGYTRDELIGRSSLGISLYADPAERDTLVRWLQEQGFVREWETQFRDKAGGVHDVLFSLETITVQGEAAILTSLSDITARKQVERALAQRTRDLERSNADLDSFASVVAHDLRAPLTTLIGFAELLQARNAAALNSKGHRYIDLILESAVRMQQLIDDLLAYARLDFRAAPAETVACSAILDAVALDCSAALQNTGGVINTGVLPAIAGDPTQIRQLFQNLIGNALKFHRPGVAPVVQVTAERRAAAWLFQVADNGIGIDPADVDRVFGMFQRVHTRGKYEGTGIGLSVCKKIVERHGGRIWIESQPGSGATVLFTWPIGYPALSSGPTSTLDHSR
jgi:PAS domain S-box-containing protein